MIPTDVRLVGVAEISAAFVPADFTAIDLMVRVAGRALADAGLNWSAVDGLLVAPQFSGTPLTGPAIVAECMALEPTYLDVVDLGGATGCAMVTRAGAAIAARNASVVLCVLAEVTDAKAFYTKGLRWPGTPAAEFERPYGPMGLNSAYALLAQRHAYEFGSTDAQRAKIVADQHRSRAAGGPSTTNVTVESILASPLICDPLHRDEIVRPCSGAAALVVARRSAVSTESWSSSVAVLGTGEAVASASLMARRSITTTPVTRSASTAFAESRLTPTDVDLVSAYDCYSIAVLLTLEDAGFCRKGSGGTFAESHDLSFSGDFPVNPHGGQLANGQPGLAGGAGHVVAAVDQLRQRAGPRQVPDAVTAFVHGNGGVMSEQVSLVLGKR